MSPPTNLIHLSFELAAERCEDLTPAVYCRLFREHPEAEAMFRREAGDLVKGSMLAMAIDAMIDFAGDRSGSFRMIECEIQSHDACGTPRKLFGEFFGVIAQTMRQILGNDWSPEIDEAWRNLLRELDRLVTRAESVPQTAASRTARSTTSRSKPQNPLILCMPWRLRPVRFRRVRRRNPLDEETVQACHEPRSWAAHRQAPAHPV